MNKICGFLHYFNPFNLEFNQASIDFNSQLKGWQRAIAVVTAIAAGIFGLGISSIAAFRFTVEKLLPGKNSVADNASSVFQNTIPRGSGAPASPNAAPPSRVDETLSRPISLQFKDTKELIANGKLLAPNEESAIEHTILGEEEIKLRIWYDADCDSMRIVALKRNGSTHSTTMTTVNPDTFETSSQEELEIVQAVSAHLKELKTDFNREMRSFHPQILKIIFKQTLNRPNIGLAYHFYDEEHNMICEFQRETNLFILTARSQSSGNIVRLHLNSDGEIQKTQSEEKDISPSVIFDKKGPWRTFFSTLFKQFLKEKALLETFEYGERLTVHQAAISEIPEFVLSKVKAGQRYKFFTDDLTPDIGADAGGPTRQFFSQLALHLFDGSPEREIKIKDGIPFLTPLDSEKETATLELAGEKLLRSALFDENITLGNIFDPAVYACFKLLIDLDNTVTEDTLIQASQTLNKKKDLDFLFNVYNTSRVFTEEEWKFIEETWFEDERPSTPAEVKKLAKDLILEEYKPQVMAIHHLVKGTLGSTEEEKERFKMRYELWFEDLSPEKFAEEIQGMKFDRAGIAARVSTDSDNPVVRQKTAWLKEYILESGEEEIKRILMAITGSTTVTEKTDITISEAEPDVHNCSASTCYKSLKVPITHTSVGTDAGTVVSEKQLFLNNFRLIYSVSGYDMA